MGNQKDNFFANINVLEKYCENYWARQGCHELEVFLRQSANAMLSC